MTARVPIIWKHGCKILWLMVVKGTRLPNHAIKPINNRSRGHLETNSKSILTSHCPPTPTKPKPLLSTFTVKSDSHHEKRYSGNGCMR